MQLGYSYFQIYYTGILATSEFLNGKIVWRLDT